MATDDTFLNDICIRTFTASGSSDRNALI